MEALQAAALLLTLLVPFYKFPAATDTPLDGAQALLNFAIIIIACVCLIDLISKLFVLTDGVRSKLLLIQLIVILVASLLLLVAFFVKSRDNSRKSEKIHATLKPNSIALLIPFGEALADNRNYGFQLNGYGGTAFIGAVIVVIGAVILALTNL